jgi:hypothetical protein
MGIDIPLLVGPDWMEKFLRFWVFPVFKNFILNPNFSQDRYENLFSMINVPYQAQVFEGLFEQNGKELVGWSKKDRELIPVTSTIRPLKHSSPGFGMLYSYLQRIADMKNNHPILLEILEVAREYPLHEFVSNYCMDQSLHTLRPISQKVSAFSQLHTLAKNALFSVNKQRGNKMILLPGRDTNTFAVLARKHRIQAWYEPVISRAVIRDEALIKSVFGPYRQKFVMLDTGYQGSIHRNMVVALDQSIPNFMLSSSKIGEQDQVFKHFKSARNFCLALEYLPKFFKTGRIVKYGNYTTAVQNFSSPSEFLKAVITTIAVWEHESPSFVKNTQHQDLRRKKLYKTADDVFNQYYS